MTPEQILAALCTELRCIRFHYSNEVELHEGIAAWLTKHGWEFEREYRLTPADRLDFLLPSGVAIECKIAGQAASLERQITRYAEHARIRGILVITNRVGHNEIPDTIHGKPVRVSSLLAGGL